jgi:hypothetical protein
MDFGRIKRDAQPITPPEWNKIIASISSLEQMADRTRINPFTKEKMLAPGEGKAYYVVDGERMGNASLEDGEILTTGIPRKLCEQIAKALNAKVFEDDRS